MAAKRAAVVFLILASTVFGKEAAPRSGSRPRPRPDDVQAEESRPRPRPDAEDKKPQVKADAEDKKPQVKAHTEKTAPVKQVKQEDVAADDAIAKYVEAASDMVARLKAMLPPSWQKEFPAHYAVIFTIFVIIAHAKLLLWLQGIVFLLLSNEKKGFSKAIDSSTVKAPEGSNELDSKIIIFIRHGESDWNFIFNKNKLLLLPRLVMGLIREALKWFTNNSLFIDSPLSKEGIQQANSLRNRIETCMGSAGDDDEKIAQMMRAIRGDSDAMKSVLVTSNLRRAIHTGAIALWPRLKRTNEKVMVLSSLQEMSRNVDTMSLAKKGELPEMSLLTDILGPQFKAATYLDPKQNGGNKALKSRALPRMEDFCRWCHERPEPVIIVSSGHSLWYKNFFKAFLPAKSTHHAKEKKLVNCGVVAFKLEKGVRQWPPPQAGYRVCPDSVMTLYGGFEKTKEMKRTNKPTLMTRSLSAPSEKGPNESTNGANRNEKEGSSTLGCCGAR